MPNQNFILTDHALLEMQRRQIKSEWIESVMANPGQVLDGMGNRKVYQAKVESGEKVYLVRVVVEEWRSPPVIVTVYRTSKIEKYWRPE